MAWTNPLTWETGRVVSASDLDTHLRDNLKYLKGRVLAQWPAHALAISDSDAADGPELSSVISDAASEYRFADDASQKVYGYFAAPQDLPAMTPSSPCWTPPAPTCARPRPRASSTGPGRTTPVVPCPNLTGRPNRFVA